MKGILICGLLGVLFAEMTVNGLDNFLKIVGLTAMQTSIGVIISKIKNGLMTNNKKAEIINALNSAQNGINGNKSILLGSGNPVVKNAVDSATNSAAQMVVLITPLINNTLNGVPSTDPMIQINQRETEINAQITVLQNNIGTLDSSQQTAVSLYATYMSQLINLTKAVAYGSKISTSVDQIATLLPTIKDNNTKNSLKILASNLAAYGSSFLQYLNAGGIALDTKMTALITGSDLLNALAAGGSAMSQTNVLQPTVVPQLPQPGQTQQSVVQPTITQPVAQQSVVQPPIAQRPVAQQVVRRTASRRR